MEDAMFNKLLTSYFVLLFIFLCNSSFAQKPGTKGSFQYSDFKKPQYCGSCHKDFYSQWQQAMMSVAYTHDWDEIEYFKLAVPHAEKDEKVAEVREGCNGCHAPIS